MDQQIQPQGTSIASNQGQQPLDPQAVSLAKAIRQTESGGSFSAQGKSGEYGAYQFTEPTWDNLSKKYGVNANLHEATPEQQNEVAYKQIKEWKDAGNNVGQIASMWNAGAGEPNAYQGKFSDGSPATGKNKYGAQYNVPEYAKSVATAYQTLKKGGQVSADPNNPSSIASSQNKTQPSSLGGDILGGVKWLGNALFPIAGDLYNDVTGKSQKGIISQLADAGLSALPFIPGLDVLAPEADAAVEGGAAVTKGLVSRFLGNPITKAAGIGAAAGGLGAIGQGGGVKQTLTGAGVGALTGGALGSVGQLFASKLDSLPTRLTQGVFKGITPETANYALENKSVGSVENMLNDTVKSINQKSGNINEILSSPKYSKVGYGQFRTPVGNGAKALEDTLSKFPNAGFKSIDDVAEAVKNVVPLQKDLVDKVANGQATLAEKNILRQAIDKNVYGKYGDLPKLSADKSVANVFNNYLRNEVQSVAPETAPIFSDLGNEIKLRKALGKMNVKGSRAVSFRSLMSAVLGLGFTGGNPLGAAVGFGIDKLAESPSVDFGAAKVLNKVGNAAGSKTARVAGTAVNGLVSRYLGKAASK